MTSRIEFSLYVHAGNTSDSTKHPFPLFLINVLLHSCVCSFDSNANVRLCRKALSGQQGSFYGLRFHKVKPLAVQSGPAEREEERVRQRSNTSQRCLLFAIRRGPVSWSTGGGGGGGLSSTNQSDDVPGRGKGGSRITG